MLPTALTSAIHFSKSVGYVFFGGKVWDMARPLLMVHRHRQHELTSLYLFHCACGVMFVWLGLHLHPGGIFILLPYVDAVFQICAYAYLILATSRDYKPSVGFRRFLFRLKLVSGVLIAAHGAWFSLTPNCGPAFLKYFQTVYALIGLALGELQ